MGSTDNLVEQTNSNLNYAASSGLHQSDPNLHQASSSLHQASSNLQRTTHSLHHASSSLQLSSSALFQDLEETFNCWDHSGTINPTTSLHSSTNNHSPSTNLQPSTTTFNQPVIGHFQTSGHLSPMDDHHHQPQQHSSGHPAATSGIMSHAASAPVLNLGIEAEVVTHSFVAASSAAAVGSSASSLYNFSTPNLTGFMAGDAGPSAAYTGFRHHLPPAAGGAGGSGGSGVAGMERSNSVPANFSQF